MLRKEKKKKKLLPEVILLRNRISTNVNICPLYETSLLRTYIYRDREHAPFVSNVISISFPRTLPPVILSRAKPISARNSRTCLRLVFSLIERLKRVAGRREVSVSCGFSSYGPPRRRALWTRRSTSLSRPLRAANFQGSLLSRGTSRIIFSINKFEPQSIVVR